MKHIEKIIINNARRLGENTEIEFGSGATIILAPNGTGKTTIFEAIELALTGEIKRIKDSPDAIIRNGLSEVNVRLDFSEGKYCQVNYARGGILNKEGNYDELFKLENNSSLPYLFRLTHFLEQRGKEWFVDQDDKGAGNLLSQLPIGKDLQQIISKKTSLLRAIGVTETSADTELKEAERKFSEFKELRARRDELAIVSTLTPLGEIVAKLMSISKLIDYEEFKDEHNVTFINEYFEKIKMALIQESNSKKDLFIKLNTLRERVDYYISNIELLNHKETVLIEHSTKIASLNSLIEQIKKDLEDERNNLYSIKGEIRELNSIKSMFEIIEQKQKQLSHTKSEQEQIEKSLEELKKSYDVTIEYIRKSQRILDQYKIIDGTIKNEKERLMVIESKRDHQKRWKDISRINNEITEVKIPEIQRKKNECLELKLVLDNNVTEAEKAYYIKKSALESLNKASNAIEDAVSSIRKNLPENQISCPVCKAEYEPSELIKRIEASLKTINPAIPQAIEDEKNALESLKIAREKQSEENEKLRDINFQLNIENKKLEENIKEITEVLLPHFPECKNPEEANKYIELQIAQIVSQISELEASRNELEPEVAIGDISNANLKKNEDERIISELSSKNKNLQNEIIAEIESIKSINESLIGKENEVVLQNLAFKLKEEAEKIDCIQKLERSLSTNQAEFKQAQESYLGENDAISRIKGNQEGICAEWNQVGLDSQPNQEELKIRLEDVSKYINELQKTIGISNTIEQELASWRAAERFHDINNTLKKLVGDVAEEEYFELLKTSVKRSNSILANIKEKKEAVNLFLSNVISESDKIHDQLNAINEPWKRLLKRIVINPLIATAPLLSSTTIRNKPIAKTSALVHNQNIDITNIASEAQIADLQLTLMLAMSTKYQWTPWKALLLDDPTQHHDLVHASSVFDVLRDYIIDLDYQVMMSTHDTTQAKFFQRKLENEGVKSKIYQLVARKNGVTTERMA